MTTKKFLSLILTGALALTLSTPVQAEKLQTLEDSGISSKEKSRLINDYYNSLPTAKGEYKSRVRPIIVEGAMNIETEKLVRALKNPVVYRELNYLFVSGTYKNYPVVIVRTEQGMTNSAASTALAIKKFNPVAVINQGTSGGYKESLKVNDIVIGEYSTNISAVKIFHEQKGSGIDVSKREMRGTYTYDKESDTFKPCDKYPADKSWLNRAKKIAAEHSEFNTEVGTIGSYDTWNENIDLIIFMREKYSVSCEEMETASAAQICKIADIPFIGIRTISNNIINSGKYNPDTADTAQDFTLLLIDDYINGASKT